MIFVKAWWPAIVWMAAIFFLSDQQSVSVSSDYWRNFLFFKTLHVIEYALLYVLYLRAIKFMQRRKNVVVSHVIAFVLTILYAVSDEIHQSFVPTREGKVRDVIIDAIGGAVAWITVAKLLPIAPKRLKNLGKSWLALGRR